MYFKDHPIEFFTATNLNWLPVLANDFHKDILIESLQNRVLSKQLTVYAFVVMPNHFHIIWQIHNDINPSNFQRDLMKFTARSILAFMRMHNDPMLEQLQVNDKDRKFQIWERNSLSVPLFTEKVFIQKLNYIHHNPLQEKWKLAETPEAYFYSSVKFYENGSGNDFGMLTHFRG